MFDLTIAFALIFRAEDDYDLCHDLVQQAFFYLDIIRQNLGQIASDSAILTEIFSSRLIEGLITNLDV